MAIRLPYDNDLQMFVETSRPVSPEHLLFMRWLADHGLLEHRVAGPPSGQLVVELFPAAAAAAAAAVVAA
jgi:hypothetical protein